MLRWLKIYLWVPLIAAVTWVVHCIRLLWQGPWWQRLIVIVVTVIVLFFGGMYGIGEWYIHSNSGKPTTYGVSFIPAYAQSLGLDPQQTMDALVNDLHVKRFRLVSYWDQHEPAPGNYDFSGLDWQFQKAEAAHAKITLAIGLRQPRWPECHMPTWAQKEPATQWQSQLNSYITAVINRYKSSPSLESYQLENEYFNNFGQCPDHDRDRLTKEFKVAKAADSKHPIIISRSNNYPGGAFGQPQPDIVGISIYRRVWNTTLYKGYFNYPLPSWYYAANAGIQKIFTGKDTVIHELQMEPWPPNGASLADTSIAEQNKSMNADMFADRITFAKNTGVHSADLWGAEWWYWRLKHGDPSLWNAAKEVF